MNTTKALNNTSIPNQHNIQNGAKNRTNAPKPDIQKSINSLVNNKIIPQKETHQISRYLSKKLKRDASKNKNPQNHNNPQTNNLKSDSKSGKTKTINNIESSSLSSQSVDEYSDKTYESLNKLRYQTFIENKKKIAIRNIETNELVQLEKIQQFLGLKDMRNLMKYKFPYLSQNDFNYIIKKIDLEQFRKLYFACPLCNQPFRHFSMSYHIFQNHFDSIESFLSKKDIAHSCAKLMENEFKKIEKSIELFSELAILFESCDFNGASEWRSNAEDKIEYLQKLDIKKKYFCITKEDAFNLLYEKLPLNKNKRYKK